MKLFFRFLIFILLPVSANAQYIEITNLSGTSTFGPLSVTVASTGSVSTWSSWCTAIYNPPSYTSYWAGESAAGGYQYVLNHLVSSLKVFAYGLNGGAMGAGEYLEVYVNGVPYSLTAGNITSYNDCSGGSGAPVYLYPIAGTNVIMGPVGTVSDFNGCDFVITPSTGISSFELYCNGTLDGVSYYVYVDSTAPILCTGTPSTGAINANTSLACSTTSVTLTDTGYSAGTTLQWQQSADSIGWSDIAGASSSVYNFSGVSITSFYRCNVTCPASGLSASSSGKKVNYTTSCPCILSSPGTVTCGVTHACSAATVSLSDIGYSASGAAFQWQSSSDSTTWSDISGATSTTYSFTGLTSTTWYRLKLICISGGSSIASAGVKIVYTSSCACSGTPVGGTATASTTFCSACSLTLNLTGSSVADSLGYQWQQSANGTAPWSNIAGATTVPYTFAPSGAYYYRCQVKCLATSATATSSSVFVSYLYKIIVDSVSSNDTSCTGAKFFATINGTSTLLRLKTYYGDGSMDSITPVASGVISNVNTTHAYSTSGCFSIKRVLYYNNILQDSATSGFEYIACHILPIKLYFDANSNCTKETTEPYNSTAILIQIDSNSIPIDTISVTSGLYYRALGLSGTIYTFSIIPGPLVPSCASSAIIYDTIASAVNTYPVSYLGLGCSSSSTFDLAVTDAAPVTGPHDQIGYIYVQNNLCETTNATVTLYYDKRYSSSFNMRGSSMAPVSRTDSSATWNITGLSNIAGPVLLNYQVWAPSGNLASGDTVYSRVTVSPSAGDVDISNNVEIIRDTINDCEDPNHIFVSPSGCLPDTATQLQYTILFTNVGTDTAFNVYVMDTLPNTLDAKSLRLIMASNTMNITQYNDGGYNIVKFDFPGINLLDTNVCPQCSGEVVFTINTLAGLPGGSTIFNHAGVFFDYNPVVLTDTVENTVGCFAASVKTETPSANVHIFPNPATDELTIQVLNPAILNGDEEFTITSSMGQQIMQQSISLAQTKVNVSKLPPGLYYITFRGESGTTVQKFVKL